MNGKRLKIIKMFVLSSGRAGVKAKNGLRGADTGCSRGGFTLIETVAALAILAIAVISILSLFPVGIEANKRANDLTTAAMLAQLKMTEILYDRPRSIYADGTTHGLGPYICWNGSQYERIRWDIIKDGWTVGADINSD
ncbi:MAG: prepilin-type N-terminal cleavage/methylation domain-containing protein, partial [bacterium]|nr:prepilin-type N-terminal cleavage/methylation domain-containing protein [bacterium]